MNDLPLYMTAYKLAIRWHIVPTTLQKWRYLRKGPTYYKIENRILYRISDIEEFEKQNVRTIKPKK